MSAPKKKSGTGGRPTATRSGNRPGGARPRIPKAAKPTGAVARPAASAKRRKPPAGPPPGNEIVVGTIPVLARVAGLFGLAGGVLLFLRPAFALVSAGGQDLGGAADAWDYIAVAPLAVAAIVGGVLALIGKLPRFGMALIAPYGAVAIGSALRLIPQFQAGTHSTGDLPLAEGASRFLRYTVGTGLVVELVAFLVLIAALVLIVFSWRRTVMEDSGSFDTLRPVFGALALTGAVGEALAIVFAPLRASAQALGTPVPGIFSRFGMDQLGSWLELLAFAVVSIVAAVARPRLAAVGMFAALAAIAFTQAVAMMVLAARSSLLETGAGPQIGIGVAIWFALMAIGAWKLTRRPRTDSVD